ncbi:hypothetical protein [Pseudoduganella sp. HUAS MS19]
MKNFIVIGILGLALGSAAARSLKELGTAAANSGNYPRAYAAWLSIAQQGDPEAQEAIALLLEAHVDVGINFSADERDAAIRYWIVQAAKGGKKSASRWLADALSRGWHGFQKSEEGATCWASVSAGQAAVSDCEKIILHSLQSR